MNYQHCFHAGNFADIIKHSILIWCLEKLHEKNSNFLAIDTHAGAGKYQLKDQQILPNSEAYNGIKKILADKNFQNILPNNFLKILAKINVCEIEQLPNKFNFYPGSPLLIKNFLRMNDRAIFVEKSEAIFNQLKRNFAGNKKIFCEKNDGYNLLKSKLPPIQKRAIILLDPSYEKFSQKISPDYHLVIDSLAQSYQRFANGIYLLWIPIIDHQQNLIDEFYSKIKELKFNEILQVVFDIGIEKSTILKPEDSKHLHNKKLINYHNNLDKNSSQAKTNLVSSIQQNNNFNNSKMHSCAMIIFNPPWQLKEKIDQYFPKILSCLQNHSQAFFKTEILK